MDDLLRTLADLENKNNLQKSIDDVQKIIDLLETARENVVASKGFPGLAWMMDAHT